ncbi:hypothetical protein PR048_023783 [Dryococelus australis]|uniref:Uncharacterized protein n=1 Tax=Dryococelus australis TaxID=614101 RepID=A0ABQ9GV27_9NEOP|nr:hypothetical protein PR048_023783 [Dryococelus australis]
MDMCETRELINLLARSSDKRNRILWPSFEMSQKVRESFSSTFRSRILPLSQQLDAVQPTCDCHGLVLHTITGDGVDTVGAMAPDNPASVANHNISRASEKTEVTVNGLYQHACRRARRTVKGLTLVWRVQGDRHAGLRGRGKREIADKKKPADQRHRPARFQHAKVRGPGRGLNPFRLGGSRSSEKRGGGRIMVLKEEEGGGGGGRMRTSWSLQARPVEILGGGFSATLLRASRALSPLCSRSCDVLWLDYSSPTRAEPGSIPDGVTPRFSLVGIVPAGFLGDLPFTPLFHSCASPYSPRSTLISSQDLDVKSSPNIFTRAVFSPCRVYLLDFRRRPCNIIEVLTELFNCFHPPVLEETAYKLASQERILLSAADLLSGGNLLCRFDQSLPRGEPGSIPGRATPGLSYAGTVQGDATGRRVVSVASRFSSHCIPVPLHAHLASPSLVLEVSSLCRNHLALTNTTP